MGGALAAQSARSSARTRRAVETRNGSRPMLSMTGRLPLASDLRSDQWFGRAERNTERQNFDRRAGTG